MTKKDLQEMFENAVHIGHRTQKWNPKMKKFIYGEANGIHIINLEKTYEYLEKALKFISDTVAEGKTILFVSTKPQVIRLLENAALSCHMPYVVSKWIPGLLTNFATIKSRVRYLSKLREEEATGEFSKYTKNEASKLKKVIAQLQASLGGVQNMTAKPDVVFVIDTVRDHIAVKEAKRLRLPIIGITDTNADPTEITYPIPGNDDALKSLTFLIDRVCEVILSARKSNK